MAKPFMESAQAQSLRQKLRDAGCEIRTRSEVRMGDAMIEILVVYRPDGTPWYGVLLDMGENGYALYEATKSLQIVDDVTTILSANA